MIAEVEQLGQASERDQRGRFAVGNRAASGRLSPRLRERRYLEILDETLTLEEFEAVLESLIAKAKSGNVPAAKVLLENALGKPLLRVEVETGPEYRVAGASPAQHMSEMMARIQVKVEQRRAYEANLAAQGVDFARSDVASDSQSNER